MTLTQSIEAAREVLKASRSYITYPSTCVMKLAYQSRNYIPTASALFQTHIRWIDFQNQ